MIAYLIYVLALIMVMPAHAAVYKCTVDGIAVFADKPCAKNAQQIDVQIHRPSNDALKSAQERHQSATTVNARRGAERRINSRIRDIKEYRKKMSHELARLERKKSTANNNLAGATWEHSLLIEMQSVTAKYQEMIGRAQRDIDNQRELLVSLAR